MLNKEQQRKIDTDIGKRVRARRILLGLSQDDLARSCGITFQQVQKYEHGVNRISASRMVQFGTALNVTPSYFFGEADGIKGHSEVGLSPEAVKIAKQYDAAPTAGKPMIRKAVAAFAR